MLIKLFQQPVTFYWKAVGNTGLMPGKLLSYTVISQVLKCDSEVANLCMPTDHFRQV